MNETRRPRRVKRQKGSGYKYDDALKLKVARLYSQSDLSGVEIARQNNISPQNVSRWAQEFSTELAGEIIISPMTEQELKDLEALKKQNEELKRKLEYDQMKIFALETMIDLAKTELGVDVRKNFGAKQPKE